MNTRLGHRLNSVLSPNISVNQSNSGSNAPSDERVYLREKFIPPEISMINYFMNKVRQNRYIISYLSLFFLILGRFRR